ncbi:MAG: bifunctional 3,4-dihydroxy-2-butanone-4-phosphate synthase/GTP cyclohydrolase II [Bacteroidetes bacterium]|nr:bifunctional 3,4-dihydroxy-2-butanone-4-phosphate synthase/GTP cyclohydrolase II [Bacteroidota bacterium]
MLDRIEDAIEDIRKGKLVIVVDDEDRENEGDFIVAAEFATPEVINFMSKEGRGLICVALTEERCAALQLAPMVTSNTSLHETAFTVSVDLIGEGTTTGISAQDRSKTILALVNPTTRPEQLGRPGHIFPLKAVSGGVLRRTGHTEATIDLARLAGLQPAGALVEVMNEDGSMARLPQLLEIGARFGIKVISIKDLIDFRLRTDSLIEELVRVDMPTAFGHFTLVAFKEKLSGAEHLALVKGNWLPNEPVLTRVHSSCFTGDILSSLRCDCGEQLHNAMRKIEQEGNGVIVYMNQEGRGIGLINKLKAYQLQEQGLDTVEANLQLGFGMDDRDYGVGAQILRYLGITQLRLLSNNPRKRAGLKGYGLEVTEVIPIETSPNSYNLKYLETKRDKLGHDILNKE